MSSSIQSITGDLKKCGFIFLTGCVVNSTQRLNRLQGNR
jgi:hypothetical protein